jgi:UPF0176 protein
MPGMNAILNISAYRFVSLPDAHDIRPGLLALAQRLDIKGTVVLAEEGINLFVAGAPLRCGSCSPHYRLIRG